MRSKEEQRRFDQLAENEETYRGEVTTLRIQIGQKIDLIKALQEHAQYIERLVNHLVSKHIRTEKDGSIHESWQGPDDTFHQRFS